MNDEELMIKIRAGDENAFIYLVDNYKRKILSLCYSYTIDSHEAEDLSQDVFITFYKNINKSHKDIKIPIVLFYYVGLDQNEIGKILNISRKAVEGRIYRGKQKLMDMFIREEIMYDEKKVGFH